MPLHHFTDRRIVQLLSTQTRRVDLSPRELALSHAALGRFLAGEVLEHFSLEEREIAHPQGVRVGMRIKDEHRVALVALLRAGLYAGDGFRDVFASAPLLLAHSSREHGLAAIDLNTLLNLGIRSCIVIDSVVNTGRSIEPVLKQLDAIGIEAIVAALVVPRETAERLEQSWPEVHFYFGRVSDNKYVGRGKTDTGHRLFGTADAEEQGAP